MRVILSALILALALGTVARAQAPAPGQTGTINGTVRDTSGAPVANATIRASGVQSQVTQSDNSGRFTMSLTQGIYAISVSKAGYQAALSDSVTVLSDQTVNVAVVLQPATLTSLKVIGSVIAHGGGFNITPASTTTISNQTFVEQAQPQVMTVLNQTPGIVASHPGGSANGAVPGAITFPNIRGSLSFETASLIDGHPISVGSFGDYVTTFLNSFVLGGVEVVKGPGAAAPETNYAIGGTVNFRTKDPTYRPAGQLILGSDTFGGQIANAGYSGTTTNGKLGWALDYAYYNTGGPFNNYFAHFIPNGGTIANGISVDGQDYQGNAPAYVFPASLPFNGTPLIACCQLL
ncbi:MAG: TonB-dependent receptor, partial [Candidatus Eremiobacteraeota bacterium]|nr:TonB-dependent receptor [Candidatus Eremiobacteraeota bacterium]